MASLHNHPQSSSFSPADINVLRRIPSIKEMKVIAHDGTEYFMNIKNGARPTQKEITNSF